jgi:hypothetical protein
MESLVAFVGQGLAKELVVLAVDLASHHPSRRVVEP